jgi:serine/threonine protein kinase
MERCDLNLETYILRKWTARLHQRVPFFVNIDSSPTSVKIAQARELMKDIIEGLVFIHSHKMIHRDLKPRNGIHVAGIWANNSTLF